MLEGIVEIKTLFTPKIDPAKKPKEVTIKPLEAWQYLLSLVNHYYEPKTAPKEPTPRAALEHVVNVFKGFKQNAEQELNKSCRRKAGKIQESVSRALIEAENSLEKLLETIPPALVTSTDSFKDMMEKAKDAGKTLIGILQEASKRIRRECARCREETSAKECCNTCTNIALRLESLAVDATPLLDTCYDGEKAGRLYSRLVKLMDEARRAGNIEAKLAAVLVSVIALELAGKLEDEHRWLLNLVVESLGIDRWLWMGDLTAILYAVYTATKIPEKVKITRNDAVKVLAVLTRL